MRNNDESGWVDDYIAAAQPFAKPLLIHIRDLVHRHCPQVEEVRKWSFPNFLYRGKMMCSMAAFKAHVSLSFAHGELVVPDRSKAGEAMGSFGRVTSLADLPGDADLGAMITKAMTLIEGGTKKPTIRRDQSARPEAEVPAALATALAANAKARSAFDAFSPSHRREYCEWIGEARRDETRTKRVTQALEWLAEGKKRNWKYEGC
jgi:uncharacterized protein YdeI (YjbR/CyaY-like superfamily)